MNRDLSVEKDEKGATASLGGPTSAIAPKYRDKTIALVGLMGAGKSSVGRRLAETLGRPFYDSDDEIEAAAGLSVTDIFELHGEEEFRRVERRVIERLLGEAPHVLGTGGGAYLNEETRALMKERAVTIWLDADLEVLWKRVSRRDGRPLLKADNPKQVLADLLDARAPVYAEADIRIRSEEGPHTKAVDAILKALST